MQDESLPDKSNSPRLSWRMFALLFFGLASSQTFIRQLMIDRPYHALRQAYHDQIILRVAEAPHQYRLIPAYAAETLQRMGVSFDWSYLILHGLWCLLAAILLYVFLNQWLPSLTALGGTFFFFAILPLTYLRCYYQEGDMAMVCLFLGSYLLLERKSDRWLYPLVALGLLVRETAAFVPLLWFMFRWDKRSWPRLAVGSLLWVMVVCGGYLLPRMLLGWAPAIESIWFLPSNLINPIAYYFFLAIVAPLLVPSLNHWTTLPESLRRGLLFAGLFLIPHLYMAFLTEVLRYLLPVLPFVIAAGLSTWNPSAQPQAPLPQPMRFVFIGCAVVMATAGWGFYHHWSHEHPATTSNQWVAWHAKRAKIFAWYGLKDRAAGELAAAGLNTVPVIQ